MKRLIRHAFEFARIVPYCSVLWFMQRDIRSGKRIVVYQIGSKGQLQYLMPIHLELSNSRDHLSFYLCSSYPMPEISTALAIPTSHCFPDSIAKFMPFIDVYICTEIQSKGPKNAIRIFSGHGHANKLTHWAKEYLRGMDLYFLHSPLERAMFKVIQDLNPKDTQHIELINVGYPKIDDLINRKYDRLKIMQSLGFDPHLKTVIYSPAWDPGGSLRTYGTEIVSNLLTIPDINVIVKLHPASMESRDSPHFDFYTGGKEWKKEFSHFDSDPRFCFVADYMINPYLFVSDLMVNDFSGVALEYMSLNRPIIYIDCPEYYEKILPAWKCDPHLAKNDERFNAGRHVGTVVSNLEQLRHNVITELLDPERNELKRRLFIEKVMYNPGRGATVASAEILKRLRLQYKE